MSTRVLANIQRSVLVCILIMGCRTKPERVLNAEAKELASYTSFFSIDSENALLANPTLIRYDGHSNLLIYDSGIGSLIEIDGNGQIIQKYGRQGRGPGEYIMINNIFIMENYVYAVDNIQKFIFKYVRASGRLISTMNYGQESRVALPPLPPLPVPELSFLGNMYLANVDNQPYVTRSENVFVSSHQTGMFVYDVKGWNGNYITSIGRLPLGTTHEIDYVETKEAISNREVPGILKPNAFVVEDRAKQDEYYVIYSALSIVSKYNQEGNRLWEHRIDDVPELIDIENHYYMMMNQIHKWTDAIVPIRKYTWGVSSKEGELFLSTYSSPNNHLWIHKFDSTGELKGRFKINSGEDVLLPIFDIDFSGRRVFTLTREADIRIYPF